MRPRRLLFFLGGSAAFDVVAEEFVPAAGGCDATIALLMQGGREWQKYVPEYTQPWIRRGVSRYYPIVPGENGRLDLDAVSAKLREATGIFIGGGHTPTYHRLYATEPIRSVLRESYQRGVPIAGVSAGALIAPEICMLPPDETDDGSLQIVDGLGLVSDLIVGVHFTELNALPGVLEAMARTQTRVGWGIDEPACAVFEDGEFKGTLGRSVYEIVMTDFETKACRMKERAALPEPKSDAR
ncbi:MAG: Type 1 glutamine amidotransferase-like domain-containing protein [Chloroflexi bacterium]|nr:Type 1 glutamine amidotransferase-like domain-containing protein [Chloroflexota bacterium]